MQAEEGVSNLLVLRGARDGRELDEHVSILDELLDSRSRVGVGDLGSLSWVQPDYSKQQQHNVSIPFLSSHSLLPSSFSKRTLSLADSRDGGGESLLHLKVGDLGHCLD